MYDELLSMGFKTSTKGTIYILDAEELIDNIQLSYTIHMYQILGQVAEKHFTTWKSVERCIRHAISTADPEQMAFKLGSSHLSVKEFLFRFNRYLKNNG